jgi:hypothetical protein
MRLWIAILGWLVAGALSGRAQELPPAPIPVLTPPLTATITIPPAQPGLLPGGPPLPPPPGPPACAPFEDANGPLLRGDPLLDLPGCATPGWIAGIEATIVGVHIKNRLAASVPVLGPFPPPTTFPDTHEVIDTVHLPMAQLDWVGSPRIEIGYRFPEGFGEFIVSYRSLVTEGQSILTGFDIDGSDGVLRSRLNMNVVDLDYNSREFSLWPHWDMKWRVGVRIAAVFFDSQAVAFSHEERTSNNFVGAGPHVGLDLTRCLALPGLSLFGRVEGAAVVGKIRQAFEENIFFDDGSVSGGAVNAQQTQAVPVVHVQAGLTWAAPCAVHPLRLSGGYELEQWWNVGQVGSSQASITAQGIFLRAEWNF